jgi:hypothetical protein
MTRLLTHLRSLLSSLADFTTYYGLITLRPYQLEAAQAVLQSILDDRGHTFIWKFARQSGKDETIAALAQYLLMLYSRRDTSIVCAAPTFKPQVQIAMQRLSDRLTRNLVLKRDWARQSGYTYRIRRARILFLSADPSANVVGATAWPLLIINEAQDVLPSVYDKRFAPMAAANNATRLFCGTAWTHDTLLAREERLCRLQEQSDGLRRVFVVDGPAVAQAHPAYGRFLDSEMARLGPDHPIIISQYLCREIDNQVGMFPPGRRALMQADDAGAKQAAPGALIAFLIDVAGQDENRTSGEGASSDHRPRQTHEGWTPGDRATSDNSRDSTTLSIVSIDLSTLQLLHGPTYRVLRRLQWTGANHLTVFGQLKALADTWRPRHIVIDATGVGEGLWAMLDKTFPTRVIPVKFTASTKSEIGYRFLAVIETGRFRDCSGERASSEYRPRQAHEGLKPAERSGEGASSDHRPRRRHEPTTHASSECRPRQTHEGRTPSRAQVDREYAACIAEVLIGPQKTMRWGVPDGTRDENGELVHDDIVLADALTGVLDRLEWFYHFDAFVIPARDPLDDMSRTRRPSLDFD